MPSESKLDFRELIPDVRQAICAKHEADPQLYDEVDVERVRTDDWSSLRYIKWNRGEVDKCIAQLDACLQWRRQFGVNVRTEADLPHEFIKAGAIFPYGHDSEGRQLIYMRIKVYKKVPQLVEYLRQFLVGVINRVDQESSATGYALVFDLTGVGFSNADMDFLQFLINVLKSYFPYGL
ncbi:unnamed protein product, partial [Oppiella nova]